MPDAKLRWGILGTARIADAVIDGIRKSNNSELVAVASRDAATGRTWAAERSIPLSFGSYTDMLASDEIEAVYIPLPNGLHKEWCIKAAEHGKHVLCEKPLALNSGEVHEIIEAARRNGVKVMEAFMYRFHPQTERIRQLVAQGAIGNLKIVRATFDFYLRRPDDVRWSKELGGGALMDVGCYCVNMTMLLTGASPHSVTASAVWTTGDVDMSLAGTLEFDDGVLGTMDCSFQVGTGNQQWLLVSGTEGLIRLEQPFSIEERETTIMVDRADGNTLPEKIGVPAGSKYALMVEHFADAALNNTDLSYSLESSLATMQVLDALALSARTGKRVQI